MRYAAAYGYVLLSGVGLPYALRADDLIGRMDFLACCETTAWGLLLQFCVMSSAVFAAFMLFKGSLLLWPRIRTNQHLRRILDALSLSSAGFASASWALTDHHYLYGTTWAPGEAFMAFVVPVWPAILIITLVGALVGARLEGSPSQARRPS